MPGKTLIVLGSGPGIGVWISKIFCVRGFTHVALVSRNKDRLADDRDQVLEAVQERGYACQVKVWDCDLSDLSQLNKTLQDIEDFGSIECVVFNAARVAGRPPLEESTEQLEADFRLTNLALYDTAKWAIPLLSKHGKADESNSPSFFVTSTTQLWKEPLPELMSLSMAKSAQRAQVLSLHHCYGKDVHIALINIGGVVSPEKKNLSPENIAEQAYALYKQRRGSWQRELEIPDDE